MRVTSSPPTEASMEQVPVRISAGEQLEAWATCASSNVEPPANSRMAATSRNGLLTKVLAIPDRLLRYEQLPAVRRPRQAHECWENRLPAGGGNHGSTSVENFHR